MLQVGIIGYGRRISNMAKNLGIYDIPYQVSAVADPRAEELRTSSDELIANAQFYTTADELLANAGGLDGIMIGTRCHLHTEMACQAAATGLPIFLEKPVAITFEQVMQLDETFRAYQAPVVVSFPLRVSPMAEKVKEIIDSGQIGTVEQMIACNDVPYGSGYFRSWHRNVELNGGLWLQKATHDLDYLNYLVGQKPKWISAMNARRVYGGDMPFDLQCKDCHLRETCPESPFTRFRFGYEQDGVEYIFGRRSYCVFSEGIELEDMGSCMIEYENGAQLNYTQNFFARYQAARRGARIYGYKGTIEFDWYENRIRIFSHTRPTVETIDYSGNLPHHGGDRELCFDFLMAMRDGAPSRAPMSAGIVSALTCLWARESSRTRQPYTIVMEAPRQEADTRASIPVD